MIGLKSYKMEVTSLVDMLIGLIIAGGAWWANSIAQEVKRLEILLNRTREDYATRNELKDDMDRVMEALHRVEDKLDRILSNK
jgi:hypothetical protein